MQTLFAAPRAAIVLGVAGLIPFVGASAAFLIQDQTRNPFAYMGALMIYGAVILSFLGGARWGLAIAERPDDPHARTLIFAVIPSIAGWIAAGTTLVGGVGVGLVVMIAGFAAMLAWDLSAVKTGSWPTWYRPLRLILTLGAIFSLAVVLPRWLQLAASG